MGAEKDRCGRLTESTVEIVIDKGMEKRSEDSMNRDVLAPLPKDELHDRLLAQECRHAAEIVALTARNGELERRLVLNNRNSRKPPSSDGLKKPPRRRSPRQPSGRKMGGRKGHKGETLRQVAEPDATVDHGACSQCASALTEAMATGRRPRPDGGQRPPGVRCARAAARGRHRTPCAFLPLRPMRHRNASLVSRRGGGAGPIRPTHPGDRGLPCARPASAEERLAELMEDL